MIKINDRFSLTKDAYNVIIIETVENDPDSKFTKNKTRTDRKFFPNIELACVYVLRKSDGEMKSVKKILKGYKNAVQDIKDALKEIMEEIDG